MKSLNIVKCEISLPGIPQTNTIDLVKACLNNVPESGFSYEDLKLRQRIEDACLKSKKEIILLEDNDANNLKILIKQMRWGVRHNDIVSFCQDVENL